MARITVCRMVDRGSIPRRGVLSLRKWFSGKIQRCHRWAPGSIPGLRIFFYSMHTYIVFNMNIFTQLFNLITFDGSFLLFILTF